MAAEFVKVNSSQPDPALISYVADQIMKGQVIGLPTDTFYALAADPLNLRAVEKIYEIKSRMRNKALSLLIENVDQAEELARPLPELFYELAWKFWPGPLTMIVKAASRLPLKVTANTGNVALRLPKCTVANEVVRAAGFPITATAASLANQAECTTAEALRDQLGNRLPIIVNGGETPNAVHTTIVDLSGDQGEWRIIREGAILASDLEPFFRD